MTKIDLMIIGAQKAGTTSLKNYLGEHPNVLSHIQTEFSFFHNDEEYDLGFESVFNGTYGAVGSQKIIAKNATLYLSEKGLKRLREHNQNCIIALVLRNPVERAFSAHKMGVYQGWEDRKFEEIVDVIKEGDENDRFFRFYLQPGMYHSQVESIQAIFPSSNIHIFKQEELISNPKSVCDQLFEALGLPAYDGIEFDVRHNQAKIAKYPAVSRLVNRIRGRNFFLTRMLKKTLSTRRFNQLADFIYHLNTSKDLNEKVTPTMSRQTMEVLDSYYSESIRRLEEMRNLDLSNWRKNAI